jgi:hypothetical protein
MTLKRRRLPGIILLALLPTYVFGQSHLASTAIVERAMNSGSKFKIREKQHTIYVEEALSEASRQAGDFVVMELRRFGEAYDGKERVVQTGYYFSLGGRTVDQLCSLDYPVVISLLTESRIEGRINRPPAEANDARAAKVVEMRFFGGLLEDEIAEALEISIVTVKRDWRVARAWRHGQLRR